jgi:hypothetical protein
MHYAKDCTLTPVTPVKPTFTVVVLDDPNACDAVSSSGGEPVELGDRAIWNSVTYVMCVKKGDRTINIRMATPDTKSEALKIAIKVLTHL